MHFFWQSSSTLKGRLTCLIIALLTSNLLFTKACAQPFTIVVHVRTHDGKPPVQSHASLTQNKVNTVISIPPWSTHHHSYQFSVKAPGVYWIRLTATHHRAFRGPVLIDGDSVTEFEVRLGTLQQNMQQPDSVFLAGTFNAFRLDSGLVKMTRHKDVYAAIVTTPREDFRYRPIVFIDGDGIPVDAPGLKTYYYDSNRFTNWASGSYYAVARTNGRKEKKIIFQPGALITSDLPVWIRMKDSRTPAAALMTAYAAADFRMMKFRLAQYNFLETRQLGDNEDFFKAYGVDSEATHFSRMATSSDGQVEKDVWNVASLHFTPTDSVRAAHVAATLEPGAIVWKLGFPWTRPLLTALPPPQRAMLAEKIAAEQKDDGLKSLYLQFALEEYHKTDEKNFIRLYDAFMGEFAAWSEYTEMVSKRVPVNRNIAVGKQVPHFSLVSMERPGEVISSQNLKGKTYLLDLWATWCTPCVAQLDELHRIYESFKSSNFTIVSISFDENREVVQKFRQKKWTMPWFHAYVGRGKEAWNEMGGLFEMQGLPRAILVDSKGIIRAVDEEATGANLERFLSARRGSD